MQEFYYTPLDIATIIGGMELGAKGEAHLLDLIWEKDRAFIAPKYRKSTRRFFLQTAYWSYYLHDKAFLDSEFPVVQKELWLSQGTITEEQYISEYLGIELFFKSIRIRILQNEQRKYVRIKLRSLLRQYGYKRRSPQLLAYLNSCLLFYHLQPYLKGDEKCSLEDVNIDDWIIFREA